MESLPFVEDIYPEDLLFAATIRSPAAKGRLKNILIPELPDDYKLISAKDIPGENRLEGYDMPIFANDKLSYIGEPVAIIIGKDKTKLEELAARSKVFYDEDEIENTIEQSDNDQEINRFNIGNADEIFASQGKIITGSYSTGIQAHWYAEPVGAVTWWKEKKSDDKTSKKSKASQTEQNSILIIKTATQWQYHVKRAVERVLGLDSASVSVEPTNLSIHMDGKLWYPSLIACHAALGTFITKKPIRLILSKEEDFLYSPKRFSSNINIASSIDDNGKILASKIDISVNLGAYMVNKDEILKQICLGALGFYKFDNLDLTIRAKNTNIPPSGPFSGFGLAQGQFAIEKHVSEIADAVNQDQAQWRLKNADTGKIIPAIYKNTTSSIDLINDALKMSDYYRKWASYELLRQSSKDETKRDNTDKPRGIGFALGFQSSGLIYPGDDKGIYSAEVTLTKESILEIKTSITSSEDYSKIWEKIAAEIISIKPEMVKINSNNAPLSIPDCGPSCSSRNITAVTNMVEKCCLAIKKQRFRNPLPITVRRSIKPQLMSLNTSSPYLDSSDTVSPNAASDAQQSIANLPFKPADLNSFSRPGFAAAVVEVSIDPVEFIPVVRSIWLSVDGGKIISKNKARRSIMRAVIQALGWSFIENIEYINGALSKSQYENFSIISPAEIPPIHINFLSTDESEPKGVGDLPFTCVPAAFLQAVSQAADYSFKSIPLKRKDLWEMKKAQTQADK